MQPIKVGQLNSYIKRILGTDPVLSNISVAGEIVGLKFHSNGHVYFTLKDESSSVSCFFPSDYWKKLSFNLSDGLAIIAHGYINVYEARGSYSLNIRKAEPGGAGALAEAFEKLKTKLRDDGLFDKERKKPIPFFPRRVGVITSDVGSAIKDILKIIKMRNNYADIILYPSLVQGNGAASELAGGVKWFNAVMPRVDVIIIGRGGGSPEDLWVFNNETLARAIAKSEIPIISAVGHETDFTISDYVADRRAETPTAAAAIAVPDTAELKSELASMREQLDMAVQTHLSSLRERTESRNVGNLLHLAKGRVKAARAAVYADRERLISAAKTFCAEARHGMDLLAEQMKFAEPSRIMSLGYAAITDSGGSLVRSAAQLSKGDDVKATFADGAADMRVMDYNIYDVNKGDENARDEK